MSEEEIEKIVREIIAALPEQYAAKVANVQIFVERKPIMGSIPVPGKYQAGRQSLQFSKFLFPDKIIIYKMPLLTASRTLDEARKHIRETVLHELTYYFGLSEQELMKIKSKLDQDSDPSGPSMLS